MTLPCTRTGLPSGGRSGHGRTCAGPPPGRGHRRRDVREHGAAVVEFLLVSALLTGVFLVLLQIVMIIHVRNVLLDCAAQGARLGATSAGGPVDAAARARRLISDSLGERYAGDVAAGYQVGTAGSVSVTVTVRAPLPMLGRAVPNRGIRVLAASAVGDPAAVGLPPVPDGAGTG